jgi:glycosyltransferase involved in cell wall biosynthesis
MSKEIVYETTSPLVSIIMNCFNGESYLGDAIESVLDQTYKNWEIIFWDNQSDDNSAKIFNKYKDPRFKYFLAKKHTYLYEARNYAIEKSTGSFIAFLDVDDWWLPNKLEKQILLFSDKEVGFTYGNYFLKNELKKKKWLAYKSQIPTGWVLDELLKSYFVGLLTLVVRRSAIDSLDYYCDSRYHVMGDLDLVIRLSINWKSDAVQEPIAVCRKHGNNELYKHRTRHVNELECWIKEMTDVKEIYSNPSFHNIKINYTYQKAIDQVMQLNKMNAVKLSFDLPWGLFKLRLWVVIITPIYIIRRIKSYY